MSVVLVQHNFLSGSLFIINSLLHRIKITEVLPIDTILHAQAGSEKPKGRRRSRNGLRKTVSNNNNKLNEVIPEEAREPTPDPEVLKYDVESEEKKSPYTVVRPPPKVRSSSRFSRLPVTSSKH